VGWAWAWGEGPREARPGGAGKHGREAPGGKVWPGGGFGGVPPPPIPRERASARPTPWRAGESARVRRCCGSRRRCCGSRRRCCGSRRRACAKVSSVRLNLKWNCQQHGSARFPCREPQPLSEANSHASSLRFCQFGHSPPQPSRARFQAAMACGRRGAIGFVTSYAAKNLSSGDWKSSSRLLVCECQAKLDDAEQVHVELQCLRSRKCQFLSQTYSNKTFS
jgi:hypothetical protein